MRCYESRVGETKGRLTLLRVWKSGLETLGEFSCSCGSVVVKKATYWAHGNTRSCGCLKSEKTTQRNRTHGGAGSAEYKVWVGILSRCHNPNSSSFHKYGARGVTVCDEWRNSFEKFFLHMGVRPTEKHSIERVDNALGYSPENCCWATATQQARNKGSSIYYEMGGVAKTLKEWANGANLAYACAYWRHQQGWSIEKILGTPSRRKPRMLPT